MTILDISLDRLRYLDDVLPANVTTLYSNRHNILDAIKRIALAGRRARIRVLVQDPRKPLADGHRLIALAQRLPSLIEFRTPQDEQDRLYASAFLINDRRGYFFRTLASRNEGESWKCVARNLPHIYAVEAAAFR